MVRRGWSRGAGSVLKVDGSVVRVRREGPRAGEWKREGRDAGRGRWPRVRGLAWQRRGPSVAWVTVPGGHGWACGAGPQGRGREAGPDRRGPGGESSASTRRQRGRAASRVRAWGSGPGGMLRACQPCLVPRHFHIFYLVCLWSTVRKPQSPSGSTSRPTAAPPGLAVWLWAGPAPRRARSAPPRDGH